MSSLFVAPDAIAYPAADASHRARSLAAGNALLLLAVASHAAVDATHDWRAPTGLPVQLWAAAAGLVTLILLALVLAVRGDSRAPAAAMLAGFTASIGGLIAHAGPPWGPLSQFSFWAAKAHTDAASWALLGWVFVTGLGVGVLGLRARSASTGRAGAGVIAPAVDASGTEGSR